MKINVFIWAFYMIGQALHILANANAVVHSKLNAIPDWSGYFKLRWVPLVSRIFLSICAFVILWDNPSIANIESYIKTAATQAAVAGMLGWFSDSVLDKVLSLFPWMQKELPIVPPGDYTVTVTRTDSPASPQP